MLPKMLHWIHGHVFLLIGLVTLCLLLLIQPGEIRTGDAFPTANPLPILLRILIAPMYLAWMLWSAAQVAIVGPVGLPQPWASILSGIGFVAGLAPYALADYILGLWRRQKLKSSAFGTRS
jgi:hypothetical protein